MIKRIVQKIKIKKIEKLENFFQRGDMKKKKNTTLRALARTRAKNSRHIRDTVHAPL